MGDGNEENLRLIDEWVGQGHFSQAAGLAAKAGLHDRASQLFEQACDYGRASDQASLARDDRRALVLAAFSGDSERIEEALISVVEHPHRARAAAEELRARGHGAISAQLIERLGDLPEAARLYAESGLAIRAADVFEAIDQVREAARILEAAHRADPSDHAVALRLAKLLTSHHRFEAATRLLQSLPDSSPWQERALPLLASCYEALGLEESAAQARKKMLDLGWQQPAFKERTTVAQVVYGRYEILQTMASSHAAQVFKALDRVTHQYVAIKQLDTQSLLGAGRDAFDRLTREARALSQLGHANVVPLVELVSRGGAIVTPWMSGGSLVDLMEKERITPSRAVEIASSVLLALAEAHRFGILHRDVKPSNILFDEAGVARLADFGAAHVSDSSSTATAGVIGTFAYMSPEQRYGRPATPASDVFGVGATLLEMLTGHAPPVSNVVQQLPTMCHPDLNEAHDSCLLRLIAENPEERFQHALDARKALLSLSWPTENRGSPLTRPQPESPQNHDERLSIESDGIAWDRWLERRVLLVPDSPAIRKFVQLYASVGEPGLASALRFDEREGMFWFDFPDGLRLRESGRSLNRVEAQILAAALRSLHHHGIAHGSVDADHIVLRDGFPILLFEPKTMGQASVEQDKQALDRLWE